MRNTIISLLAVGAVGFSVLLSVLLTALPWIVVIGFIYWLFF